MKSDYQMLVLLSERLRNVFPDMKSYECYNAFLPLDVNAGDSSSKLGNHAATTLTCKDRIGQTCAKAGLSDEDWQSYCNRPLAYLIARDGAVARIMGDAGLARRFFLGSDANSGAAVFVDSLGEAYLADLDLASIENDGRVEDAQNTASMYLERAVASRGNPQVCLKDTRILLAYLLNWTLGGTLGQKDWEDGGGTIIIDDNPPRPSQKNEGLVIAVAQGTPRNVLGKADVDPFLYDAVGFGHAFRTGTRETNVKVRGDLVIPLVSGVFNLPAAGVETRPDGKTMSQSTVSRRHALLNSEGGKWKLYDLGSSNGTVICRAMGMGQKGFVIVGAGKRYAELQRLAGSIDEAATVPNIGNAVVVPSGTGCEVYEDDYIYLGFEIGENRRGHTIVPTADGVILHVLPG